MTLASGLALMCAVRADEAPKPPEIVQRVIASYTANVRGVIGMQRHFSTLIDAGVAKHAEVSDSAILFKDGAFEGLHYYRVIEDGKEFSASQLAERDQQALQGWFAGKVFFKEPYDRRFAGDYTFASTACPDCVPGTVAVTFESQTHDEQHGAGTMWIQTSNERVLKLTYAPYVLPPHATSGSITETSGQATPDLWYVVKIDETYQGRMLLLHGSGTFTGVFDHFTRFGSVAEGANAVREGLLGTTKS
jgi:hypothetical protein